VVEVPFAAVDGAVERAIKFVTLAWHKIPSLRTG
jgi:hypothetical protein